MSILLARYLIDEASSGTGPTTLLDDTGNGNGLAIDYSSGDAAFTSITAGNGLDFTAAPSTANTAIAELADIVNNGNIGSGLNGTKQITIIAIVRIDAGDWTGARLFHIGTNSGNGDIGLVHEAARLHVRWDLESGGSGGDNTFPDLIGGVTHLAVKIDTGEALAANRLQIRYNNILQTAENDNIAQNVVLDSINSTDRSICIGNRQSLDRNIDGAIYYFELHEGILTDQQITDSYNALIVNNDVPWDAVGFPITTLNNINGGKLRMSGGKLNG